MSYTRTQTQSFGPFYGIKDQKDPFGSTSNTTSHGYVNFSDIKSGEKNEDWRARQKKGELVASPYSRQVANLSATRGLGTWSVRFVQNAPPNVSSMSFNGFASKPVISGHLGAIPVTTSNRALSRILGRIRDTYQHAALLPDIAELRSTVHQFGAPAAALIDASNRHLNRVYHFIDGLPAGSSLARKTKILNVIASSYLEWVFGVEPLIGATRDAAEAVARWQAEHEDPDFREIKFKTKLTASASSEEAATSIDPSVALPGGSGYATSRLHRSIKTVSGVRYVVQVDTTPMADFGSNDRLLSLLGIRAENIPLAAWELLPWSWMADYFLNVQQMLEAGVTLTNKVQKIVKTTRQVTTNESICLPDFGPPSYPSGSIQYLKNPPLHFGRWQSTLRNINRTVPTSLGIPEPTLSYPTSTRRLANMVAALFARKGPSVQNII